MPNSPLDGVRVLDVSGRIGAYCTKILADLGADVIKVESPTGDRLRHPDTARQYDYYHHNKRGITLDWEREQSIPILAALAARSKVVVASPQGERRQPAGFVDAPPSLTWVGPQSLTCFITPFGLAGPCHQWRATPFTSFAMSGLMFPAGPPEGPPLAMPGQPLYDEAGIWAAFMVQAMLLGPGRSPGHGQVVDISAHEVGLFHQLGQDPYGSSGKIKTRETNFAAPPSGIWQCADGRVDIAAHTPQHWDIFVELVGSPPLLTDPIYGERTMRIQLFDLLTDVIAGLLRDRPASEFVRDAQAAGLPCVRSQTPGQFIRSEQVAARSFLIDSGHGVSLPGAPFVSSPPLISYRRAAPGLGQHNDEVYAGELGYSAEELEKWRSDGLI